MKKWDKNIIINSINVGGIFGFKEDNFIKIDKELWPFIEGDSKELKFLQYILFGEINEDLNIDYSSTVPKAQVDMTIDGVGFHVIRLPQHIRTYIDGKKSLCKELLSYKYGDKEIDKISNAKFETVIKDLLQISR